MASLALGALPPAPDPYPLIAAEVARGVTRMLLAHDLTAMAEVPLDGGRRADLMAIDARGQIVIVEIKVSRADLLGDGKWTDYLGSCDRYFWAVPAGFDVAPLRGEAFLPDRTGIIVADRYEATILREASTTPLPAHVRKRCTLAFARRAARRLIGAIDPDAIQGF
ncbi:transcription elongation factor [Sphingomonas sp. Leaf24]|uniref:MmcB family DNA repair protein n=1 Tax=unclassified Sphingomonas TaxID=196159 RepID=UPI0007019033|nr:MULTISPECIES: MmcB family DNA repair protein [unclassified Sphingomonas]KQM22511.1 transcription elongation factor [Sphingomonas sp. Leaf5]KQM90338.1 transcription elongation factor [Sphingomonas sp. Leaf22]KQM94207.1 transcription elongation factor [Sphingomonas sp. Leaf24]